MTRLVRSRHAFAMRLASGAQFCAHPGRDVRFVAGYDAIAILDAFAQPRSIAEFAARDAALLGLEVEQAAAVAGELARYGLLHEVALGDEDVLLAAALDRATTVVPPPATSITSRPHRSSRYQVSVAREPAAPPPVRHTWKVAFLGYCEVQLSLDVFVHLARARGIEAIARASAISDVALVRELDADFVVIGHMNDVRNTYFDFPVFGNVMSVRAYVAKVAALVEAVRADTLAPILIANLPVPTCSPLGAADRGEHRNKARAINLALDRFAARARAVHVVDLDAAFSLAGKRGLLDDSVLPFEHLGPLRFLEHARDMDAATVWDEFPSLELLDAAHGRPSEGFEEILAREYLHAMLVYSGNGRRKCVAVDLDGTLWPGVLAERGAPFPLDRDLGWFSLQGLYLGLHQALLALRARGVLLACISKNDRDVVTKLWRYPEGHYTEKVLRLEHFSAVRIGWGDKSDALAEIADELGFGLDAFVFVDDSERERERIRSRFPEVRVLGDNPFLVRWELLTDPELQMPAITEEARARTTRVAAPPGMTAAEFVAGLGVHCAVTRVSGLDDLERLHELCARTNQFNTTARRYTRQQLGARIATAGVYAMRVRDRLASYGLVGVAVVMGNVIELVAMSCRVIGLGVEDALIRCVLHDLSTTHREVLAELVPTDRNAPVRDLFQTNGFVRTGETSWSIDLSKPDAVQPFADHLMVTRE